MSIEIKLVVNKKQNKVAFAECDSEFVDVLFSFMTLPLGTIVRLLDKKSGLGCMDNLYDSVEKLEVRYLQTSACKTMLLQPRSNAECLCEDLVVNINDSECPSYFICQDWDCRLKETPCYYTSVSGVMCSCGKVMDYKNLWAKESKGDGIFVEKVKFMVSDDLHVVASSVTAALSLFQKFHVNDSTAFEETTIQVGKAEVLELLKRSFVNKTPLTDVFLNQHTNVNSVKEKRTSAKRIKLEDNKASIKMEKNSIRVKIIESESDNDVFIVESGNDFVNLLFSFLTIPLGRVISLLLKRSSSAVPSCVSNLYKSVENLSEGNEGILLDRMKEQLLNPKLYPYFSCSDHPLNVDEMHYNDSYLTSCKTCFEEGKCSHGMPDFAITELNPKLSDRSSEKGGGFARTSMTFMTGNDMVVKPASAVTTLQLLKDHGESFNGLRERVVYIGETQALNLLKACLSSGEVIDTSIFE